MRLQPQLRRIGVSLIRQMTKPEDRRLGLAEIGNITNLKADGSMRARDDNGRMYNLGNRLWHSDASFRATGAGYSLLSARVVPGYGGNTEFADMRAAYDTLDEATKAEVEELITEHSIAFSRGVLGFSEYGEGNEEKCARCAIAWCAPIPSPGESHCTCQPISAASSAGQCRRR